MKKNTNTAVALAVLNNAEATKAETANDEALIKEALQEEAIQEAGKASRDCFRKSRLLAKMGKTGLSRTMEKKGKFIFARTLRIECAKRGVEVPSRN